MPRHELAPCAVEDYVAGNGQLHLLCVNPSGGRRRNRRRQSHLVPEVRSLLRLLVRVRFLLGFIRSLHASSFRRVIALFFLRSLWLRHALPPDYLKARTAFELHQDVLAAGVVRTKAQVRTCAKLAAVLWRNI